jgi:threonyl-tRNA synthetase
VSLRSRREGDLGSVAVADLLEAADLANKRRAAGLGLAPQPPLAPT